MAVFADTFFYLALLGQDDPAHDRAVGCAAINQQIVTSEFILLELGNDCAHAADHGDFFALIDGMRASPRVHVVALDSRLLSRGLERMASRADKDWSLIDCISFIIMEEADIHEALTADQHFEQAGFIALLK